MRWRLTRLGGAVGLLWFLLGCVLSGRLPAPTPAPLAHTASPPTLAPGGLPVTALPVPSRPPDTGWETLRPGLERRLITLPRSGIQPVEALYLIRVDPAGYRFDVAYRPGQPQALEQWLADTGALLVVNGGFYTEAYVATGLIVVNGRASGVSYQDFGGMLAITAAGPELRWLPEQPYDPAEPLLAGLQSFPMLVRPSGVIYPEEDGLMARRTVVAQDRQGRFLFIIAGTGTFTLHQISRYLVESDLEIEAALNLDGGPSSGLLLAEPADGIPAYAPLPAVIIVYPKVGEG
ncbi:MAG: phosphodiester glycosidase family protein [Chloroflexi bacterium]|nr:phosphodiester glycosidase family protein [Chloroflexota bacterium]MCI0575433.1 phosphodiester glycosidase family protein [Chloroflexota bacterium]MCI0649885.1 phosphodiester glycosidase family protein [Chloroflexota bacterium]MCI0725655.1 phosphodiester glycosidase family protein [Chloroflexota bacterium]